MSLNSSELRIWRVPSTQAWQHELQRWKYSFKSAGVPVALARWCFSGLTTMDHRETAHNVWPKKFRPKMSSAEDRWISLLCFIKVYTDSDYSSLALLLVHSWRQSRLTMFGKKKINRFSFKSDNNQLLRISTCYKQKTFTADYGPHPFWAHYAGLNQFWYSSHQRLFRSYVREPTSLSCSFEQTAKKDDYDL